ncbi:prepilin-type N-terminal cleavage/methylation domain-containing protein [Virgibacillus sp. DJP39]|uniref:prepilin-type N-terminal cleavage/methylation domain-containing protein n=1 Tax=Virgibacillus sp. DJP39 TaxID=3409790 RepID=UPI003BB7F0AF
MKKSLNRKFKNRFDQKGFTLIELLAVLAILGIILLIAVPTVASSIAKANREVCNANVVELERFYEMHLDLESLEHTDVLFTSFAREFDETICPEDGRISYVDGDVHCSIHSHGEVEEDVGGVPFL